MNVSINKAIFLDRDGVINEVIFRGSNKPIAPWSLKDVILIPGIKNPIDKLCNMGFLLFVVSSQPDISKGHLKLHTVKKMNEIILDKFPIKEVSICPHEDRHNCLCRKPKPGMLIDLSKKWAVDLNSSFLIGDNWKDIYAGKAAGCKTILLDRQYNSSVEADFHINDLSEAVSIINSQGEY